MVIMVRNNLRLPAASAAAGALVLAALWGSHVAGQTARTFVARLSPVPITVAMQETVSGRGAVTAVLAGNRLTIEGTFEGLRTPATVARVHLAPRAMRGPAIADLTVSTGRSGTIKGAVDLTDRQREALEKSSIYVQIHSEKAPEGNLWGWLLPQEVKR
jgi:hypothetical protein